MSSSRRGASWWFGSEKNNRGRSCVPGVRDKIVSKEFMRKYIHIAKAVTPVLTEEAANHIAEEYSRLRSQEQMGADMARVSSAPAPRPFAADGWSSMSLTVVPLVFPDVPGDGPHAGDADPPVHGARQGPHEQSRGAGGLRGGRGAGAVCLLQKGLSPPVLPRWTTRVQGVNKAHGLVSSTGPGEGEETLETRAGLWLGGGRGGLQPDVTENHQEVMCGCTR